MQFELPQGYQSVGFMGFSDPPEAAAEDKGRRDMASQVAIDVYLQASE